MIGLNMRPLLVVFTLWLGVFSPTVLAADKLALVLSGGGARGGAHIGVLRELEARNIKPDLIVGVSFGALVGGLYSAGMSLDRIEDLLGELDLRKNLQDRPDRGRLTFREKQQLEGNLINFDIGVGPDGIKLPRGLLQGQELSVALSTALLPVANEQRFSELPIPFIAVATDLASGEAVLLEQGNLALSIQASLAVPVVFAPVRLNGRLLVDGGVANNLPVDVARDRGATRVIAVDASMPRYAADELENFLTVIDQLTTLLTRSNSDRQIERLGPLDFLIEPELGDIGSLDLSRIGEAEQAGREAAAEVLATADIDSLEPLVFAKFQLDRMSRFDEPQPIDSLTVFNGSRLDGRSIVNQLRVRPGDILKPADLEADLRRIYAMGIFERIETDVVEDSQGRRGLEIRTREKTWGPNYLNFGAGVEDNFRGSSAYSFRLTYKGTGQNPTGGELRSSLEIGQQPSLSVGFFQPIGYGTPWFADLEIGASRRLLRVLDNAQPVAEYLVEESGLGFDVGRRLAHWGEFRLGVSRTNPRATLEFGNPVLDPAEARGSLDATLQIDTLDSLGFPTEGVSASLEYLSNRQSLGGARNYEIASARVLAPYALPKGSVFLTRLEGGEVLTDGTAPPERAFTLGGFGRLSGFSADEIAGSKYALASLMWYRPLTQSFAGGQLFQGFSVERGNVILADESFSFERLLEGYSAFVGLDTQFGPLYLTYGVSEGGRTSLSLTLGRPIGDY